MESYLQSLPNDLHNIINNYVKDQIDLTIENLKFSVNLIIKSGRVISKIRIAHTPSNFCDNRKKFIEIVTKKEKMFQKRFF